MLEIRARYCAFGVSAILHLLDDQDLHLRLLSEPGMVRIVVGAIVEETSPAALETAFIKLLANKAADAVCMHIAKVLKAKQEKQLFTNIIATFGKQNDHYDQASRLRLWPLISRAIRFINTTGGLENGSLRCFSK